MTHAERSLFGDQSSRNTAGSAAEAQAMHAKPAPPTHPLQLHPLVPAHVRMLSSCGGALLTSLVLTPLDVVKTRLQAQAPEPAIKPVSPPRPACIAAGHLQRTHVKQQPDVILVNRLGVQGMTPARCSLCEEFIFDNGLMEHVVNKSQTEFFECKHKEPRLHGMFDGFVKIFRQEGVRGLYSGLTPTLVMAVPSVVTYFTLYDWLRDRLGRSKYLGDITAPLVAGSFARAIAATLIAPLELVRTQHQAAKRGKSGSMMDSMKKNSHPSHGGLRSLWRGLGPTLWRDVPFSGLYWLGYEQIRALLTKPGVQDTQTMGAFKSFVSGAGSGMMAAILTHPFDVAKTRVQVLILASHSSKIAAANAGTTAVAQSPAPPSTAALLRDIVRTEGVAGLYAGVFPRLTKVAPSCAIMISAYEAGKELYRRQVAKHGSSHAWL